MKIRLDFNNKKMLFQHPIKIFSATELDSIEPYLLEMESYIQQGYYVVGYLSYESSQAFNLFNKTHDPKESSVPLLLFGVFDVFTIPDDEDDALPIACPLELQSNTTEEEYNQNIAEIHEEIRKGNTYQINYTIQFISKFSENPYSYYRFLQQNNRANYCAYINYKDLNILSISPELFFKIDGQVITTKPMKGTTSRGRDSKEDESKIADLLSDKNQAENMMIVDLLRNDLSRISKPGSVIVKKLFESEKYPTVWQLTSTIQSTLRKGTNLFQIFQALFPCGSITGAPKASSMRIITKLEKQPRGIYCGSIGYIEPFFKHCMFNIPIRTLTIQGGHARYGVGGGITWDSTDTGEYNEILEKTAILHSNIILPEFLIETLLLSNGQYFLLNDHLKRLSRSAAYFDFKLDYVALHKQLQKLIKLYENSSYKVRITLAANGSFTVNINELSARMVINKITLATKPVDNSNIYLYHKTSNRFHLPKVSFGNECICYNQKGEITEFVNGNIVLYIDNQWVTPKIDSGLLPGIMRQNYINQHKIIEQTVLLSDLCRAEKVAFINSVRGWISIADSVLARLKVKIDAHVKQKE